MGNKKISQPIFWTFTLVLLFMNWHNVFCITTGGSLVSKARQYKSPFHSYSDEMEKLQFPGIPEVFGARTGPDCPQIFF